MSAELSLDIHSIKSANQALHWWLVHGYLYYRLDQSLISDADYNTLGGWLVLQWDDVTSEHKHLVTLDDLKANSCFAVKFPKMVELTARTLLVEHNEKHSRETLAKPTKSVKSNTKRKRKPKKSKDSFLDELNTLFDT